MSDVLEGEMLPAISRGRASTYSDTVADFICERIAAGEPLRQICREEGMPKWRTVYDWLEAHERFAARFARAREIGFDAIAQEALEIAEDGTNDWIERETANGGTYIALNAEHVQRSKLRVDTRLKLLSKWDPKRYGDRTTLAGDPEAPLSVPTSAADLANSLAERMGLGARVTQAEIEAARRG